MGCFCCSRLLISNGRGDLRVQHQEKDSKRHLNKGKNTRLSTDIVKIGHYQSGQLKVPGSPPSAMPCFSFLRPGGCQAFEKVKESVKDSLKRRLTCAALLSRPSWISTCLPLDERPVSQMVDDTTQIPDDLYQSLLHAGRQAKSTTSGQHRTHLQANGLLVLRLASMTKAQELKFADWIFGEAG